LKAVWIPPTSLVKLEKLVLSVTVAVICFVYEHWKPSRHLQLRRDELPGAEVVWVGHTWLVVGLVQKPPAGQGGQSVELPTAREYFPVSHWRQKELLVPPIDGLYVPATQGVGLTDWIGQ
jgi:hypothetical protein